MRISDLILILFFVFLGSSSVALAQGSNSTIFFEGPSVPLAPLSEISVSVNISTEESINAFDFEISFSKNTLEFLGFDNASSIVDVWQKSPKLLANDNIGLTGGMLQPFTGEGEVVKLSFKVLSVGTAELVFSKSDIYLADGKGTKTGTVSQKINFSIDPNGQLLGLSTSSLDDTPPTIFLEVVKDRAGGPALVVFDDRDEESGIKKTQMRFKKWLLTSSWEDVENPVLYPSSAWFVELRAENGAGKENMASLFLWGELLKKVLLILIVLILGFYIVAMYNENKQRT